MDGTRRQACSGFRTPVSGFQEGDVAHNQTVCVRLSPKDSVFFVLNALKEHCPVMECQ